MEDNTFVQQRVETDSLADLDYGVVREDSADPLADLPRAGTFNNGKDPEWAGDAEGMAVGPQTGAEACQAKAPTGGHAVQDSPSNMGPAEGQLSQANGAVARCTGVEQAALHPAADPHFGLQTTASGAVFTDQSSKRGSESREYGDIRPPFPSGGGRCYRHRLGPTLCPLWRVSKQCVLQLSLPQL